VLCHSTKEYSSSLLSVLYPRGASLAGDYKFLSANCNASYIGETNRHFSTRLREHLFSDKALTFSNIYRLQTNAVSLAESFIILDSAATKFQVKIKEAMYISWDKPASNQQTCILQW